MENKTEIFAALTQNAFNDLGLWRNITFLFKNIKKFNFFEITFFLLKIKRLIISFEVVMGNRPSCVVRHQFRPSEVSCFRDVPKCPKFGPLKFRRSWAASIWCHNELKFWCRVFTQNPTSWDPGVFENRKWWNYEASKSKVTFLNLFHSHHTVLKHGITTFFG